MSRVANVILTFSGAEADMRRLQELNENTKDLCGVRFSEVEGATGSKALERGICVGAFNYLDVAGLIEAIRKVNWHYPGSVQLFICNEEEDRFTEKQP